MYIYIFENNCLQLTGIYKSTIRIISVCAEHRTAEEPVGIEVKCKKLEKNVRRLVPNLKENVCYDSSWGKIDHLKRKQKTFHPPLCMAF